MISKMLRPRGKNLPNPQMSGLKSFIRGRGYACASRTFSAGTGVFIVTNTSQVQYIDAGRPRTLAIGSSVGVQVQRARTLVLVRH